MTTPQPTLFDSTSEAARKVAAAHASERYAQIAMALANGPACIFEVAQALGCLDHQISGRFGEMEKLGLIHKTGVRRTKPTTGCQASVYAIEGDVEDVGGLDDSGPPEGAR
jgi:hypothetical protein